MTGSCDAQTAPKMYHGLQFCTARSDEEFFPRTPQALPFQESAYLQQTVTPATVETGLNGTLYSMSRTTAVCVPGATSRSTGPGAITAGKCLTYSRRRGRHFVHADERFEVGAAVVCSL